MGYYYNKKKNNKKYKQQGEQELRVRLPRGSQIFGRIEAMHGGKRMTVKCSDDKMRMCRIPGRVKRMYVRPEDYVIVEPWPLEGDKKGDITWKYRKNEVEWLKKRGYLKNI